MIGAGPDQTLGILRAKKMGLRVLACDANKQAIGFQFVDDYEIASVYDIKASIVAAQKLNKKYHINGVMMLGTDTPLVVAKISHKLGLPGLDIRTAELASDKYEMKKQFLKFGVPTSWFVKVKSFFNLKKIVKERGYPLVIKPIDSRGSRGVIRLNKDINLRRAYRESSNASFSGQVMVEEYLEGAQFSTESIIYDDFSITPGISRRNYEFLEKYNPYFIENGGDLPPNISPVEETAIKLTAEKAGRAIGINRWTTKGDMVLTSSGPKVIEVAARLSGGYFASVKIPYNSGVDIVRCAIQLALGKKPDLASLIPRFNRPVSQRYFFLGQGRLKKIKGEESLKAEKWVLFSTIWVKPGAKVGKLVNMSARSGTVITHGNTSKQAISRAKKAIKMVHFEIE